MMLGSPAPASRPTDVLVIGGGVIGVACAYFLARAGCSVRLVERDEIGRRGASWANCGLVTPSHAPPLTRPGMVSKALRWMLDPGSPFHVKPTLALTDIGWFLRFASRCNERSATQAMRGRAALLNSSRELFEQLQREHDLDFEWETRGLLEVYRDAATLKAEDTLAEQVAALGITSQRYVGHELRELEPALRDEVCGARLFLSDAHLRPDRLVDRWAGVARGMGVLVEEGREVRGVRTTGGTIESVETAEATFRAAHVVLATGAWSPRLGRALGLSIPVRPGKGYTITMERPGICPRVPLLLKERSIAVTPWRDGYRLGGTMEFAGYREGINRTRVRAIVDGAALYLREAVPASGSASGDSVEEWFGWRPMSYDELPFIGPSPRHHNLTVATGHGMLGISMAPGTGKLVAELVTNRTPHVDPSPYSLTRGNP